MTQISRRRSISKTYTYVGATSGNAHDFSPNTATISFHGSTAVGDTAFVVAQTDDPSGFARTPAGWTSIALGSLVTVCYKVLTSGDISSPPAMLSSADSNAWMCFVVRGLGSFTVYDLYTSQLSVQGTISSTTRTIASGSATTNCIAFSFLTWKSNPDTGTISYDVGTTATVSAFQTGTGLAQGQAALKIMNSGFTDVSRTGDQDTEVEFYIA